MVASAPVHVEGKVCGGNEIDAFQVNGKPVDVSGQTCVTGNGVTSTDECYLPFDVAMPEKDLAQAAQANAPQGSFKRGSNRVIADASDVRGNRAFNTDVIFGLGTVQSPAGSAAMALELGAQKALNSALANFKLAMTTDINPAFVAGLKEDAAKKFFNAKCTAAITDFTNSASAALQNADLGTVSIQPDCSCDLNNVPVNLDELTFDNSSTSCDVDFVTGQINVSIKLPKIRIQARAHDSCTDHGLFGECIARTKLDVTAVTKIQDIKFDFAITETQIETKTPPDPASFTFAWTVLDNGGNPLFKNAGTCSGGIHDGKECYFDGMCEGGSCAGAVKNTDKDEPGHFDPVTANNTGIECWGADVCTAFEAIGAVFIDVFTFGLVDGFDVIGFLDFDVNLNKDLLDDLKLQNPDPMELNELQVDENAVKDAGSAEFTPGPIDVTIEDGGLTAAFGAEFSVQSVDPEVNPTPGAVVTPASAPTVSQVTQVGDDVTMLIADDVFNQVFAAMKTTGKLKAFCTPIDGLTVDDLLPAESDGGCETLGPSNVVGATIRGMCYAIRGADCNALPDEGGGLLNNTKQGVCVGFRGGDCTTLPFGPKQVCNLTPYRDIQSTDGVLVCARQDMEPDLLIAQDDTTDTTVDTSLLLEDLNVVFALDRNNDGAYTGSLDDLPGCFSADSNGASDCKVFASCLDLTIAARMGIDGSQCNADQAGFVFSNLHILEPASTIDFGVMCNAATTYDDELVLLQSFESKVIDTINQAAEKFTPPICVDGLTLGGVLDFNSDDAKLFGLTTDGGTGYSDFLGITVGLKP